MLRLGRLLKANSGFESRSRQPTPKTQKSFLFRTNVLLYFPAGFGKKKRSVFVFVFRLQALAPVPPGPRGGGGRAFEGLAWNSEQISLLKLKTYWRIDYLQQFAAKRLQNKRRFESKKMPCSFWRFKSSLSSFGRGAPSRRHRAENAPHALAILRCVPLDLGDSSLKIF